MKKSELRQYMLMQLKQFANTPEKSLWESRLYQKLFASPKWQEAKSIGVTFSLLYEINTLPIIKRAFFEQKIVALARVDGPGIMNFYPYEKQDSLVPSKFGILEPVPTTPLEPELLLVPGVVFNSQNQRIGFGGGFYDRYLALFQGRTLSLAFSFQLRDDWESDAFDLPVEELLCPF